MHTLITKQGKQLMESDSAPWEIYPRPQMRRDSYVNLNGLWDFAVSETFPEQYSHTIRVPFSPESLLSGINKHFSEGTGLYYRRKFSLPEGFNTGRVLLHIGAADQTTEIYVNQTKVGYHEGGYESFTIDITSALKEENELVICCRDDLNDLSFPYGKQVTPKKRGGMWYTPVSGIWQSVWLESVPESHIQQLHIENRDYAVQISIDPPLAGTVHIPGLGAFPLENGAVTICPEAPHLWSPEDPYLYDFSVETACDKVESYFAIRHLETKTINGIPRLCLNGKPYFFHGLLDQGYWPDGLLTPAHPNCFAQDILAMKSLGFNTLRKHIKIEPEQFYYDCDRLGMVVFQDMVNNGDYDFLRDTALPTVGLQRLNDKHLHRNKKCRTRFLQAMEVTVKQLKNHPCICYWTIFNEGWGQFDSDRVFEIMKALDSSRFIDSTSGWFRRKKSDVDSRHVYFRPIRLKAGEKPLVLSEFGGYSSVPKGHAFTEEKNYGYGKFEKMEDFQAALEKLYWEQVLPAYQNGLCAAIYTQVSDVEDETNGLVSYDREICKADPEKMLAIAQALAEPPL